MNKKMNSGTPTLDLTGFTADKPPKHKSDRITAWSYTDMLAGNGNFPIPFPSQSRTSKNYNASTQAQFHKSTDYEGEAKDAINNSDKTKRRKVVGDFQAGESEKNMNGGRAP